MIIALVAAVLGFSGCGGGHALEGVWRHETAWGTVTVFEFASGGRGTETWYTHGHEADGYGHELASTAFVRAFTWSVQGENFLAMVFSGIYVDGLFYEDNGERYVYYSLSEDGQRLVFYSLYGGKMQSFSRVDG